MQCIRTINKDLCWIGASDRKLALFENVYPIPSGVSYNSYLLTDEKTVLMDTADAAVAQQFFENLRTALNGRGLDYLVIHHMEPDHCALIEDLLLRYPEVRIVTNSKAAAMIRQFFDFDLDARLQTVGEGDTLSTGSHELHFVMTPMVHWPEVMMSYDSTDHILFAADAFGTFGALNGHLFADELDFDRNLLDEARRYYTNIVGKYGMQVQNTLKKAATLNIRMICPLHGPVWRENLGYFIEKYDRWSKYEPEVKGVLIVYASIYGHTEAAANHLALRLSEKGVKALAMYDASHTDVSYLVSDSFKYSHLVLASSTYNNGIFTPMENYLLELKCHNLQNRRVALIENGSWAPQSGKLMRALLDEMKQMEVMREPVSFKSALKNDQCASIDELAEAIAKEL